MTTTDSWLNDWATGDMPTAAEFRKGMGCIADSTLGVPAASIDFMGLPTTYAHLRVELFLRYDVAAISGMASLRFNGDSTAIYDYQVLTSISTSVTSAATVASTAGAIGDVPGASATGNVFSAHVIDIPNYATAQNKSYVGQCALKRAAAGTDLFVEQIAGFYRSGTAISRITINPPSGNFIAGSRASVYVMGS